MYNDAKVIFHSLLDLLHIKKSFFAVVNVIAIIRKGKEVKFPENDNGFESCWLDKISKISLSTKDGVRDFIIWTQDIIDPHLLSALIFEAFFEKKEPESRDCSVKFEANEKTDLAGEKDSRGCFVYLIVTKPEDNEWSKALSKHRIQGQLSSLNIERITVTSGDDSRTFYKCPDTGFFYPFKTISHFLSNQKREAAK